MSSPSTSDLTGGSYSPCPLDSSGYCARHRRVHPPGTRERYWAETTEAKGERYRRLWDRETELAAKAAWKKRLRLPSLVGRFILALTRHARDRFRQVPEPVYQARLDVCQRCEHYRNAQCLKCGCGIKGRIVSKARWASERCPLPDPKWGTYVFPGWLPWAIVRVLASRFWMRLLAFANGGPLPEVPPPFRRGCAKPRLKIIGARTAGPTSES